MHDEDCAIGLDVQNIGGEKWTLYGDKRGLDTVNEESKRRCLAAIQASADEIYDAWKTQIKPDRQKYRAWAHAPTLESAYGSQTLAALFTPGDKRRVNIKDRRDHSYTTSWWFATTAAQCANSGRWKYPITI